MLIVLATAKLGEGVIEEGQAAMQKMIAASREEEGCLEYAYAQDITDPGILRVVEKWKDEDALAFHFATPHMAEFQAALAKFDISFVEAVKFQTDEGRPLL